MTAKIVTVNALGSQSPNFDLASDSLPVEVLSYAKNYIVRDNKYTSFNADQFITINSNIGGDLQGHIEFVQKSSDTVFYVVGGRTSVWVYNLVGWFDISNVAGYPTALNFEQLWDGCKLGSIPILTNYEAFPEYWSPQDTSQKMQDLPFDTTSTWRARNYKCKVIRSHLNFLFALGLKEGATELPNAYRWSHPADIGGLPFSWDELDTSTIASKQMLEDEYIIDGCSLRNEFAIYTNRGIHFLTFTGSTETPFTRRKLSTTQSLLTSKCVVEAAGANYFLANGDILVTEGSRIVSVLDKRMKNFLANSLSPTDYNNCFAVVNSNAKEIWFFIVQADNRYPNLAIIINYQDNNVSMRDIVFGKTHGCFGLVLDPSAPVETWDSENTQSWSANIQPWNDTLATPFEYRVVTCNVDGQLETPEPLSNYINTITNYNTVLERTNLQLDNSEEKTTIIRFTPRISTLGTVLVEIGSQDYVNAPVRWKPGVVFDPSVDRKVDIRSTGDFHAWRVSSIGREIFSMSGFDIIYESAGKRIGGFIPVVAR